MTLSKAAFEWKQNQARQDHASFSSKYIHVPTNHKNAYKHVALVHLNIMKAIESPYLPSRIASKHQNSDVVDIVPRMFLDVLGRPNHWNGSFRRSFPQFGVWDLWVHDLYWRTVLFALPSITIMLLKYDPTTGQIESMLLVNWNSPRHLFFSDHNMSPCGCCRHSTCPQIMASDAQSSACRIGNQGNACPGCQIFQLWANRNKRAVFCIKHC